MGAGSAGTTGVSGAGVISPPRSDRIFRQAASSIHWLIRRDPANSQSSS